MDGSQCPGYYSATEFHFHEGQADDIVRVAAYHRRDFDLSVIWFPPREHDAIRHSIATPFHRTSCGVAGLGSLDRLPTELAQNILTRLDMRAVFHFRQLNSRAREVVDSLWQYQMVVLHGLGLFCAVLRTGFAMHISLRDFHNALSTKYCAICGRFGGFLFLMTWTRCCFTCLTSAPEIRAQTPASAQKQTHLIKAESRKLNALKTLPGKYSLMDNMRRSRFSIVSTHEACKLAARKAHHPPSPAQTEVRRRQNGIYSFMASCALFYDIRTKEVYHGISCAGCQLAFEKDIIGARGESWASRARDMIYGQDDFLEHFRRCEQAQLLWRTSGEGKHRPPELPMLAITCGYLTRN